MFRELDSFGQKEGFTQPIPSLFPHICTKQLSICPKTSRAFTLTGSSSDAGEPQELEEALPLDIDAGALEAQTGGEAVSGIK